MRKKKEYSLNESLSIRLTEKCGVDEEVLKWINSSDKLGQDIIKAIKFSIRLTSSTPIEQLKSTIELEAELSDRQGGKYGKNRGKKYRKKPKDTENTEQTENLSSSENQTG